MPAWARYPSLTERSVVVTGGGSGIGAQIVRRFCEQGSRVAFLDIDRAASEALLNALAGEGLPAPLFLACDLRDVAALRAAVEAAAAAHGPVTVLVNNAARDDRHPAETVTPEYWDERFAVNLRHQFFAAQAAHPMMLAAGGGSIVNMGSVSWMVGQGGMAAYTAAKSAVLGLNSVAGARLGTGQHPRQLRRARLDHHRAASAALADAGRGAGGRRRATPRHRGPRCGAPPRPAPGWRPRPHGGGARPQALPRCSARAGRGRRPRAMRRCPPAAAHPY